MEFDLTHIVSQLNAGDQSAFKMLYTRYQRRVKAFVAGYIKDSDQQNEIVQEVFVRIWLKRERLKPDTLEAYLLTIARNLTLDHLANVARRPELQQQQWELIKDGQNSTETHIFSNEYQNLYEEAVSKLPAQRQQVFKLVKQDGLSYDEVASQLGISKNTVRNQMVLSFKFLKTWFRRYADLVFAILAFLFLR